MGSVSRSLGSEYDGFAIDGVFSRVGVEGSFSVLEKFVTAWRIIPSVNWHFYESDCPTLYTLSILGEFVGT